MLKEHTRVFNDLANILSCIFDENSHQYKQELAVAYSRQLLCALQS